MKFDEFKYYIDVLRKNEEFTDILADLGIDIINCSYIYNDCILNLLEKNIENELNNSKPENKSIKDSNIQGQNMEMNNMNLPMDGELPEGNDDVKVVAGDTKTTIDVNEKASETVSYVLVATITAPDKNTADLKFNLTLPKYALMSWDEYMSAEVNASVVVSGLLTGKVWANATAANVYLEDEDGGYYVYAYSCDQAGFDALTVGATYEVSGLKDVYYGTAEIKNAAFTKLSDEVKEVAPVDVTEIWNAATDNKDTLLANLLGRFVSITGVEMTNITNDGKYINFKRATDDLTSYIYISSSSNFVTADEIAQLNEKCIKGRLADVYGYVALYNSAFYLIPASADSITLQALPELTDAEKVAAAVLQVKELDGTTVATALQLPKPDYESVTFAWVSSDTTLLGNDGVVVSYPLEAKEVTMTVTVASGDVSEEVVLTLTVPALAKTNIADLDWSDSESTFIIEGKVIAKDKYTDFYVADSTGVVYVYSKLPEGISVGDYVKCVGTLTVYGLSRNQVTKEFMNPTITKLDTEVEVLSPVQVDLADLCTLLYSDSIDDEGALALKSRYQGLLYEITGYVRVKTSGSFTNVYIATENSDDAPCLIYNYTNDADDIAAVQALEGKLVTLIAPIHDYSVSYNGWRIGPHINTLAEQQEVPTLAAAQNTCLELYSLANDTEVEVLGTVLHVYAGNGFVLQDETAAIYVYDKNAPTFNLGDVVRVSGKRGFYNGVAEVTNSTSYKVEKIQPNFALTPQEMTLEEFLALDGEDASNFGIAIKMEGTLVVGSYINLKISDSGPTNLYLSSQEKEAVLAMIPEGVTEFPVEATFITYQYRNGAFYVFIDVPSIVSKLAD